MSFVRTVLGDIDSGEMGVTYAHEHLIIDGGRPVELSADFLLADVERLAAELTGAAAAGLRTAIDAMPADCGRNPAKLAELSRRSGVRVVAATGLQTRGSTVHRTGACARPRTSLPTCSSRTSTTGSTRGTMAGRSSAGPTSEPGSSKSVAAWAARPRATFRFSGRPPPPMRGPAYPSIPIARQAPAPSSRSGSSSTPAYRLPTPR
jgi:hypothetical protein